MIVHILTVTTVTVTLIVGKWDNGIRVGLSEKMKVGANDSNEMLIDLTCISLLHHTSVFKPYQFPLSHFPTNYFQIPQANFNDA